MRITESRIRQIIREETKLILCESDDNSSVLYTGIVVNYNDSVNLAVSHPTLPQKWLTSNIASHGNEQLNHHMTVTIGALHLNNPLRERLNEEIKLNVVGWGIDLVNGVAAWKIEVPHWIPVKTKNPHITAALRDSSVKPFLASNIKNWVPLKEQFVIGGIFREVRSIQE